ncbi:hypothetical protein NQ314_004910 [Rhamnusium bicolor]|uniref:DDE Tnp4 domain-containing protein n=1 Tax=Rhamnusium bicolor TaxID=1586634 RepID=A0AAV8ZIR5_9CUCU|nr:hypothetical protein NQ314_004910 [Rhamnusium bicolor]
MVSNKLFIYFKICLSIFRNPFPYNMSDHLSSSDEYFEAFLKLIPKSRAYFEEVLLQFSDELYIEHFRLTREMTEELANRFANSEYYKWQEGDSEKVTPLKYITVFCGFAANEATSFRKVFDRFDITKSTLFKIVKRFTYFLSNLSPGVIKWPNDLEKVEIETHFRNKNFPGVIGIIHNTHIRIDKPAEDPDFYLNRKHFYSIQAQVVCDYKRRIRDIFVRYPGSVYDSRVLSSSPLNETLPEKCGDSYILGDSGYPCLKNLLTPFRDNGYLTRRQRNYNYILSTNVVFDAEEQVIAPEYDIVLNEDDLPDRDDRDGVAVREEVMNNLRFVV